MKQSKLEDMNMTPAYLQREWQITIQTPAGGLDNLLGALGRDIPLRQGAYDNCLYVRNAGRQRFRALDGSHAGAEGTVQTTDAAEVVFSIAVDEALLNRVFETIFANHVNEEPTVRIQEVWGCRSKYLDDKDNPNRYWNRPDAKQIHGEGTSVAD
ncbi:MAG: hypothetical protein ACR2P7_09360 [bacterium]